MRDIVSRVHALSFIDPAEVLVFARFGRSNADGAFATCHSLNLPTSDPGYYFWRDRHTGVVTRRSEWFVMKSPQVVLGMKRINYLISFVLPRFCDQSLLRSRKKQFYPADTEPWVAKLDTVIHELYHIDPQQAGIRRFERADGGQSTRSHAPGFYEDVARMVGEYLSSDPDPSVFEFLRCDFRGLQKRHGGVIGTTFRSFPSYPQRYTELLEDPPAQPVVRIEPLKLTARKTVYSETDLHLHQFFQRRVRRLHHPALAQHSVVPGYPGTLPPPPVC